MGFLSLNVLAVLHMVGAYAIVQFLLIHIYMTTTGHTIFAHLKAMITGWELVDEGTEIQAWERAERKNRVEQGA